MAAVVPTAAEGDAPDVPRSLLRSLFADPAGTPEELALFAVRRRGPRAEAVVARIRGRDPTAGQEQLHAQITARGMRACVGQGAFVGGPFLLLIPVAFCAAILAQAQLTLELAALAGKDPRAPERAAELLVLQGAHPDVDAASAALEAHDRRHTRERHPRGRWVGAWQVCWRMAGLLGLTGVDDPDRPPPSWPRRGLQWLLLAGVLVAGFFAPLVWLPYMANSYRTATRAAVHRANAYYFGPDHVLSAGSRRLDLGMAVAVLRAVLSVLLVAGLLVLVLFTDLRLFGGRWPTLALVMVCTPFAVGAWWHLRRRRRAEAESEAESEAGSAAGSECETETESPPAG